MKAIKIVFLFLISFLAFSCSEDALDEVRNPKSAAVKMPAVNILTDIILKSSVETSATDLAWYASVYIEHSAGTWGQSNEQDKRIGQEAATLMNNSWNSLYDVLMICKEILDKTGPEGDEEDPFSRGVAQILTAYNLAMLTNMWGEVPWTEALKGADNFQPVYDRQSSIYPKVISYLNDGITTLQTAPKRTIIGDFIYRGDPAKWIAAANALKAKFAIQLTNVDANAAANALAAIPNAFASAADALIFYRYEATATGENPWFQFLNDRSHLSVSQTLFDLMDDRNDPRIEAYFTQIDTSTETDVEKWAVIPAPNGTARQTQGGIYSISLITEEGQTAATPLMTYHELKFIEAEAKFRTGDATWNTSLQEAIEANFDYHGVRGAADYFTAEVTSRLTTGNELNEILMQKYIASYEYEAIVAYNDYRRVPGFITLNNPYNQTAGFVWRLPYPTSEEASNSAHIPAANVFTSKVWWAGGSEL